MKASWPEVAFDQACEDVSSAAGKVPSSEWLDRGQLAVVDQGEGKIAGYTDDTSKAFSGSLPALVFGDHTRRIKYVDRPFAKGADGVKVLAARDGVDPRFLYWYLASVRLPDAGYSRHFKFLREITVPLPGLDEQRRIARVLDAADRLRRERREAIVRLDSLPAALFAEQFASGSSGRWPQVPVSSFVEAVSGGKSFAGGDESDDASGLRVLRVSAVTSGRFRPEESRSVPCGYDPPESHRVQRGDLLFSRANTTELVGAVAIVDRDVSGLLLPDKVWRFVWRSPEEAVPEFVRELFRTHTVRRAIAQRATGTSGSMKNISAEKLLSMPVVWPPTALQREYAVRVAGVAELRERAALHLRSLDALFASLQHRAFTGAL